MNFKEKTQPRKPIFGKHGRQIASQDFLNIKGHHLASQHYLLFTMETTSQLRGTFASKKHNLDTQDYFIQQVTCLDLSLQTKDTRLISETDLQFNLVLNSYCHQPKLKIVVKHDFTCLQQYFKMFSLKHVVTKTYISFY